MDHACLCTWVVFRGVPGINNVIIGAVPALCENAPSEVVRYSAVAVSMISTTPVGVSLQVVLPAGVELQVCRC